MLSRTRLRMHGSPYRLISFLTVDGSRYTCVSRCIRISVHSSKQCLAALLVICKTVRRHRSESLLPDDRHYRLTNNTKPPGSLSADLVEQTSRRSFARIEILLCSLLLHHVQFKIVRYRRFDWHVNLRLSLVKYNGNIEERISLFILCLSMRDTDIFFVPAVLPEFVRS